jgi:hypothetical protein
LTVCHTAYKAAFWAIPGQTKISFSEYGLVWVLAGVGEGPEELTNRCVYIDGCGSVQRWNEYDRM